MKTKYDEKEFKNVIKNTIKELINSGELTFELNTFEDSYTKNIFIFKLARTRPSSISGR